MTKLSELKKLAEAATPGPWWFNEDYMWIEHIEPELPIPNSVKNARFCAAMNPTQALALIEALETARGALEHCEVNHNYCGQVEDALAKIEELLG